mmetsp:Transcript_45970/g.142349  ORF Transcript_45970/g.142349 Transcript_45970/m.142349 type:complete len:402 (+) Transcript_45970:202-1407(+)
MRQEVVRHIQRLLVGDKDSIIDAGTATIVRGKAPCKVGRQPIDADALRNGVRPVPPRRPLCLLLCVEHSMHHLVVEAGARHVRQTDADVRGHLLQESADPRDGPAGASTHHESIELVVALGPDLRARAGVMRLEVREVLELVRKHGAAAPGLLAQLGGPAPRHVHIVLGACDARGPHELNLGAESLQKGNLFGGLVVWHDDVHLVPLLRGCQREGDAGAPRGALHDGSPGAQQAARLRRGDYLQRCTVLLAAAWIQELRLCEDAASCCHRQALQLNEWRVAHQPCKSSSWACVVVSSPSVPRPRHKELEAGQPWAPGTLQLTPAQPVQRWRQQCRCRCHRQGCCGRTGLGTSGSTGTATEAATCAELEGRHRRCKRAAGSHVRRPTCQDSTQPRPSRNGGR